MLTGAQRAALDHVRERARAGRSRSLERIAAVTGGEPAVEELRGGVRGVGALTLSFHPDRLLRDGRTVAEAMHADGLYRSQFETEISNGSRTAFPGGERDRWEELLFGGAYHAPEVAPFDRPKYGALDLVSHVDGGSPRFGSCFVRVRPEVVDRATFCVGDSHVGPADVGTVDAFDAVLAGVLEDATDGCTLGREEIGVAELVTALRTGQPLAAGGGRSLDDYVEAQVHGPVEIARDVAAVHADPSFRGTPTGEHLAALAASAGTSLAWLPGRVLDFDAVPEHFRGPAIPVLARRIQRDHASTGERLDAEVLGRAARSLVADPARWADWGTFDEALQHIKQLWHVLVRFGEPARP